jgi:MOSC domain-containing protein YiiM
VGSKVISVNIGAIEHVEHNGRVVETGIFKMPTTERQPVSGIHVGGDLQADTDAHGGEHKAIYAYSAEDYTWWSEQIAQDLDLGFFGENLTTTGVDVSGALVGDRWTIGSTVLEVSEPRIPCFKLTIRAGIPRFLQTFAQADRPGAYLRIVEEGHLIVGDEIAVERTTHDSISMANISIIYHRERERAGALEHVRELSEPWKRWARDQA